MPYLLALDQGTTSSRAIIFNEAARVVAISQAEFPQHFPQPAWVEHHPQDIWETTLSTAREVLVKAQLKAKDITALGISNQRETTVIWNRYTGVPIGPAIVWQDRRTAETCHQLVAEGCEPAVTAKTGLLIDPYFSATKIAWLLDQIPHARTQAEQGKLAFGTIDSFLLWHLTKGKVHATDVTNAARTLLFNIHTMSWDSELLKLFRIPAALLPEVYPCDHTFGYIDPSLFGAEIPITGLIGDQQAATVGQACFKSGMIKSTYGTGCFVMLNTGTTAIPSQHRLLTTIAYTLKNQCHYALEGSIFVAGAAIQWLRDNLHLIKTAQETEALVQQTQDNDGVYLVPAFTGLGAPYWNPEARGVLVGLTRNTGVPQLIRAALEAVAYQTADLLDAMRIDTQLSLTHLRVDGGMTANTWLMQFLADILAIEVEPHDILETSALGAALVAGLGIGLYPDLETVAQCRQAHQLFQPTVSDALRKQWISGWKTAIAQCLCGCAQ